MQPINFEAEVKSNFFQYNAVISRAVSSVRQGEQPNLNFEYTVATALDLF